MDEFEQFLFAFVIEKIPSDLFEIEKNKDNKELSKLKLELNGIENSITKLIGLTDEFPDLSELKSKLRDLVNRKTTINDKIISIESESLVIKESDSRIKSFKDILTIKDDNLLNESCKLMVSQLEKKEIREKIRNIIPDIIKKVTCNLSQWKFSVELINGNVVNLDFFE